MQYTKVNETRTCYGSFSGIRFIDSLILLYLPDKDLKSVLCINKYFNEFVNFQPFWTGGEIKSICEYKDKARDYNGQCWVKFYYGMHKSIVLRQNPNYRRKYIAK